VSGWRGSFSRSPVPRVPIGEEIVRDANARVTPKRVTREGSEGLLLRFPAFRILDPTVQETVRAAANRALQCSEREGMELA